MGSSPAWGRSMWREHVYVDSECEASLKSMYPPEGLQFQKMGLQYWTLKERLYVWIARAVLFTIKKKLEEISQGIKCI